MAKPVVKTVKEQARRLVLPVQEFIDTEASSGLLLVAVTLLALVWANSPWSHTYEALRQLPIAVTVGSAGLEKPFEVWVNDLLMAIFFFLVGLEIKRELLVGELRGWRRASLPAIAAVGGMVVPAAIYLAINFGEATAVGWGVPMATDIAFALGVLALLGDRVPRQIPVFLLALAIIDDLGAVLVIALFYTRELDTGSLALAGAVWLLALAYGSAGGRRGALWTAIGAVLWFFVLKSGIHATIAGVALALTVPIARGVDPEALKQELRARTGGGFEEIEIGIAHAADVLLEARSPLHRFEHALQPYVAWLIVPLFALLSAGVPLGGGIAADIASPVAIGVLLGLLLGKPLGITAFCWVSVRLGIARLPKGVDFRHIAGAGLLAGIGFTMALFIGQLAFGPGALLDQAKLGILLGSLLAALAGAFLLARLPDRAAEAAA
jgi:NhaA family Na+:H+ antiporter